MREGKIMDESAYMLIADRAFRAIEDGLRDTDPDEVDCERAGDVLTLTFKGNRRCILNTQRPTRQLWLAANARAWHFSYDEAKKQWFDDKRHEEELLSTLTGIVKALAGIEVDIR
jgi:iron-sulfur cluster assembly protein CyaY